VELYERIRRNHVQRSWGIRRLAREYHVHRREVRAALSSATPPPRRPMERKRPVLGPWREWIDAVLEEDKKAPRKQRHTARRIWKRLRDEQGAEISEITVSRYVRGRRRELGGFKEIFVPLLHAYGEEAEVDLGESMVEFPKGLLKVAFFEMRACASGAVFRWPLRSLTQQAFLEAHVRALQDFAGCFASIRYDNLTQAVRRVLRGRKREETERFVILRSHYLFESIFCLPGKAGAHEKGGVEGECGYFRRNHLVPIPKVSGWRELEELCLNSCRKDLGRRLEGRERTVAEEWEIERSYLRPLPEPLDTRLRLKGDVDDKGRIRVLANRYSVPVLLGGLSLPVEVSSSEVVVHHLGNEVARHERLYGRGRDSLQLDHYLELLRYKPRALAGSLPLKLAIEAGTFPVAYQEMHRRMVERLGQSEGARQMVDILFLHRRYDPAQVLAAVEQSLAAGSYDFAAVSLCLRGEQEPERAEILPLRLVRDPVVPVPDCGPYDQLLGQEAD
jgi:transposase